ncbi:HepT-like ribonuclease domain-containing protein [Archaeoglobus neptunius]|uniref:HepT-like ribonuclease domain-containing protein n=1 Tax=Archaeoglobus neptunius TaxID=2798580 RepID=UPI00192942FF|nr:DUF86 domain-containing protein [Archaeoglobus neptunius]
MFDILEACRRIQKYVENLSYEDLLKNEEKQDAVIRNIEIIGEAVKNISADLKEKYRIDWRKISGMKDKLIHSYFGVKIEIVWIVATKEIPGLMNNITMIIKNEFNWIKAHNIHH